VQLGANIDGEAASDLSGYSLSLSADGGRLAIGAPNNDGDGTDSGHVRVYEYDTSSWVQLGADIDGEAADDQSGISVSMSADGGRVAVGARYNDGSHADAGHVRIFDYDFLASSWVQQGADIDSYDGEPTHTHSGFAVTISGDGTRVAIGSDSAGNMPVTVWQLSYVPTSQPSSAPSSPSGQPTGQPTYGLREWSQVGADIMGEAADDVSGSSLSLSADGGRVAIGAHKNDGGGADAGHVRVFEYDTSSWVQLGADIDGEAADDYTGVSVSLSADGGRVAIGAHFNDGSGTDAGNVRVYEYDTSSWVQLGADIDGEAANDRSGHAVSLSADGG
jgi:hypothetical protein